MGRLGRRPVYRTTRLAQWLEMKDRTRVSFAAEVGCSGERISAICRREGIPSGALARRIVTATAGAVTLDDLFGSNTTTTEGTAA